MFRLLLNSLPTVGVFAVIIGSTTVMSVIAAYLVSRVAPHINKSHYEESTQGIKAVFALL